MYSKIIKYSEENINKYLVSIIEKLSDTGYVIHLKSQRDLSSNDSLDICVLLPFKDIHEIENFYSALNKRMSDSDKIITFFRSQDHQSFLFPGGVNIHFADKEKFTANTSRGLWNLYAIIVIDKYCPTVINMLADEKKYKKLKKLGIEVFVCILTHDIFRDKDKEFDTFWRKP